MYASTRTNDATTESPVLNLGGHPNILSGQKNKSSKQRPGFEVKYRNGHVLAQAEGPGERKVLAEQQNFAFALSPPDIRRRRGGSSNSGSPDFSQHSTSPSSMTSPSETIDHEDCADSMVVILNRDPDSLGNKNMKEFIDAGNDASFLHSVCRKASKVNDLLTAINHVSADAASLADRH